MQFQQSSVVLTDATKMCATSFTEDTQFQVLKDAITPLCQMPYDQQLNVKQQWVNQICKQIRSRLHNAKTPIKIPKVHSISPAVSFCFIFLRNYIS